MIFQIRVQFEMYDPVSKLDVVTCKTTITHLAFWMLALEECSTACIVSAACCGTDGSPAWSTVHGTNKV